MSLMEKFSPRTRHILQLCQENANLNSSNHENEPVLLRIPTITNQTEEQLTVPNKDIFDETGNSMNPISHIILDLPVIDDINYNVTSDSQVNYENATVLYVEGDHSIETVECSRSGECVNKRKRKFSDKTNTGRKRARNPQEWRTEKCKYYRNRGLEYESRKTGKTVHAREMGPGCGLTCRYQCKTKITHEERIQVFQMFWNIESHSRKWDFISRHVHRLEKKQITVANNISRRKCSLVYTLQVNGTEVRFCKTMFLHTLGINDMWVMTALNKSVQSGVGTLSPDKRGKHENRGKQTIAESIKETVRNHIRSIPVTDSHYVRQKTSRKYFDQGLSIGKLYKLYLQWTTENKCERIATERQYSEIFTKEFNIGFFMPKKDQCELCNEYKNGDEGKKEELKEKYNKHRDTTTFLREVKTKEKEKAIQNKNICVACYDMQKILTTPQSEVSLFYYKRKYATYNFTIFDIGNLEGFSYVWHEGIGKKGSNEIASFVMNFMVAQIQKGVDEFVFYSDNCSGQNRNRSVYAMYSLMAEKYNVRIRHRFLQKGHTQNEGDSMHALIERTSKRVDIFTPEQWIAVIRTAKRKGKPYNVKEVSQDDIFDFKELIYFDNRNWSKDTNREAIKWSKIKEVYIDPAYPVHLELKTDHLSHAMQTLNLYEKRRGRRSSINTFVLKTAYTGMLPISKEKYNDLISLCKSGHIPQAYKGFYESLKFTD